MYSDYANCNLCPRKCGVNRVSGHTGFCGATSNAEICRIGLHFMEEPVISGTKGSGTIFFSHCSLGCIYCQNYEISRCSASGKIYTAKQLAQEMLALQESGAHNINAVTPTHYMPTFVSAVKIAKDSGLEIPIVYNTSGFERSEIIDRLKNTVDIYLTDLKYFSPYYSGTYSNCEDYFDYASTAIEHMIKTVGKPYIGADGIMKKGVIIRHLMLPTLMSDTTQVLKNIAIRYGDRVLVSLMRQYTPVCKNLPKELNREISDEEYKSACHLFEAFNLEGFFQDGSSTGADKIPLWENK